MSENPVTKPEPLWTRREAVRGSVSYGFGILGGLTSVFGTRAIEGLFAGEHKVSVDFVVNTIPPALVAVETRNLFHNLEDFRRAAQLLVVSVTNDGDFTEDYITYSVRFLVDRKSIDREVNSPIDVSTMNLLTSNSALLRDTTAEVRPDTGDPTVFWVDISATDVPPGGVIGVMLDSEYELLSVFVFGKIKSALIREAWGPD